jgi:hypothetical protein
VHPASLPAGEFRHTSSVFRTTIVSAAKLPKRPQVNARLASSVDSLRFSVAALDDGVNPGKNSILSCQVPLDSEGKRTDEARAARRSDRATRCTRWSGQQLVGVAPSPL